MGVIELLPRERLRLNDKGDALCHVTLDSGKVGNTIVSILGRREFAELNKVRLEPALDRGYRLFIPELYNQGLSSHVLSGDARQRDHVEHPDTLLNAFRAYFSEVVKPQLAPSESVTLVCHSLGGNIGLRWVAEDNPPEIARVFVSAPMVAIDKALFIEDRAVSDAAKHAATLLAHYGRQGISWAVSRSHSTDYALGQHDYGGKNLVFEKNGLTGNEDRFQMIQDHFGAQPGMKVGGVTWGWANAQYQSMWKLRRLLSRIKKPVLCIIGELDPRTPTREVRRYTDLIEGSQTKVIPGAFHDVLNDIEPIRNEAWDVFDKFRKNQSLG